MKYKVNIYTSNHVIEHVFEEREFYNFKTSIAPETVYIDKNICIMYDNLEAYKVVDTYED